MRFSPQSAQRVAAVAATILILDQLTKAWILSHAASLEGARPAIGLTLIWNRAIAFSLPVNGIWVYLMIVLIIVLVAPALLRTLDWSKPLTYVLTGAIVGGALGNLIDRLRFGAVVDFVKVGWWPVFNLADAAISLSVLTLLLGGKWLYMKKSPIGFNEDLIPLLREGKITLTYRLNPIYRRLRPGDRLEVENTQSKEQVGTMRILEITETTVGALDPREREYPKMESREELHASFRKYYGRDLPLDAPAWKIRFEFLPAA